MIILPEFLLICRGYGAKHWSDVGCGSGVEGWCAHQMVSPTQEGSLCLLWLLLLFISSLAT